MHVCVNNNTDRSTPLKASNIAIVIGRLARNIALSSKELPKALALSAETLPIFVLRNDISKGKYFYNNNT